MSLRKIITHPARMLANAPQRQADSHKDTPPLEDTELLKIRLDQLQRLVEQQGRAMAMMEQRLAELEQKLAALTPAKPTAGGAEKPPARKDSKAKKPDNSQ